jgi:hypothetical protein
MFRIRSLILLGASFLAASAAMADEVGYVDCSAHSDATQVFGKPRRTPDTVASLPCGERFTILVYGFYFSRIQTKDGQIGYIYSSLIAVDRGATAVAQTPSLQSAAEKTKIPSTRATDAHLDAPAPAPAQPRTVSSQPVLPAPVTTQPSNAAAVPAPASDVPTTSSSATAASASPTPTPAAASASDASAPAAQPTPAPAAEVATPAPATTSNPTETPAPAAQPPAQTPTQTEVQPTLTASAAQPDAPAAAAVPVAAAAQPEAASPAQPEPGPAQPPAPTPAPKPIRPADTRDSWEKTLPSVRRPPLVELFGGFSFNRTVGTGGYASSNLPGGLGSFAVNVKPWLQVVGDSSYNFQTVSGTKTILYANHYGPRYYYRGLRLLHITPFAEALIGGSRADTTITGNPTTSQNCISFKVGGGIDYRASRRWEIRVVDVDYYRTSFGTNAHQTNYWVSTGVVLRLFGGNE